MAETAPVQTYNGDPAFKAAFLAEIGQHEQADSLIKGQYGDFDPGFQGCAIGCAVRSLHSIQGTLSDATEYADHRKVAADLGWPLWLAYLEDNIFEAVPDELSKTWPRRLAEAVPVGSVIDDTVLSKLLVWQLTAERFGVIHATDKPEVKGRITTIAEFITADAAGTATDEQKAAAEGAARDAWAARAARDVETRDAFYPAFSDYVLTVLRELPTPLKADA